MTNVKQERFWLGPKKVETPKITEDIKKYFGEQVSTKYESISNSIDEIENKVIDANSTKKILERINKKFGGDEVKKYKKLIETKNKIEELVERVEFIDHLFVFIEFVRRNSSVKKVEKKEINKLRVTVTHYEFILYGKDLAGANFDMEALVFYLLNTCIDKIKGTPRAISPFQWLSENLGDLKKLSHEGIAEYILDAEDTFQNKFGLSRRFKEAFVSDLSDELRNKFIENLILVLVKDSKIVEKSIEKWNEYSPKKKIEEIAKKLYQIRSSYTHSAIRTFLPSERIETIPNFSGEFLLLKRELNKPEINFMDLYFQAIKELILKTINEE